VNPTLLIHAVVRQTVVLVAALATATGQRSPLAQVADEVFTSLVRELNEQGLGQKVIADMLGLALRTYHKRIARLAGSDTEAGRSLWEAVLTHVRTAGPLLRADILLRFRHDNELTIRSVLRDLTESGLITRDGKGDATRYAAVDTSALSPDESRAAVDQLVLVGLHQNGPATAARLCTLVPVDLATLLGAIERLCAQGLVSREPGSDGEVFRCEQCIIPVGAAVGWEAAVFDHYQAMVTALAAKLELGQRRSSFADRIGGATFAFDLWEGHPMSERVLGFLQSVREQGMELRKELQAHNRANEKPADARWLRVTAYVGQGVKEIDDESQG
jgi:hypothetical protein